jgi:hypothetical protein
MMGKSIALTLLLLGTPAGAWFDDGPSPEVVRQDTAAIVDGMLRQRIYEVRVSWTVAPYRVVIRPPAEK